MNNLQSLNLSENDFKLIVDGLDALPSKDLAGEMMADLMICAFKKEGDDMDKIIDDRKRVQQRKNDAKAILCEDIKILQGKILMLKRYLLENNALKETVDIINHIS